MIATIPATFIRSLVRLVGSLLIRGRYSITLRPQQAFFVRAMCPAMPFKFSNYLNNVDHSGSYTDLPCPIRTPERSKNPVHGPLHYPLCDLEYSYEALIE